MIKTRKGLVINAIPSYQFNISSSNHCLISFDFSWVNIATFVALNFSPLACIQLPVSPQVSNATFFSLLTLSTSRCPQDASCTFLA